jgi:hypothetical protein
MKTSNYLATAGIVSLLFGLEFLLVPEFSVKQYGVPADPHVLMVGRYFGGTLVAYGVIFWFARSVRDDATLRALLLGAVVGNLIGLVLSAWAGLAGLQNAMAWLSVAIYGLLLLGAVYLLSSPSRRT